MQNPRKVAVIGAGAVGGYYGARLSQAGHDVHFLVRRDYHAVTASGLKVFSVDGDFELVRPNIARQSSDIGTVDWVLCALKSTSIQHIPKLVGPCMGNGTRVLVLMNGLGLEEHFAELYGADRIFGGLAFTCINRGEPGHIHHMAYGAITIGHFKDDASELNEALSLWAGSRVQVLPAQSLLKARWEKLCWNIPFSGLCAAAGGITTDLLLKDKRLDSSAHSIMLEVISAGNADLLLHGEETHIDPGAMVDNMFSKTSTMGAYRPSTMIDFVEGKPMEIDAIFAEPLRRAEALGVPTPGLALLTSLLLSLNRSR